MDMGISALSSLCENAMITFNVNEVIRSLIIDGIFVGVGSVLSFLPIIVVLFFFLSLLEDSGYMARIAFVMDKAKDFLTKAFTIIFLASLVIWFLQTFDLHFNIVKDAEDSILAMIGGIVAPIFKPLGFGDWRASTALITGFTAKESVVSTLTVLLGTKALSTMFTTKSAIVFLIFTLLYTPCVAAISSVKRELGRNWAVIVVLLQCSIAWLVAFGAKLILTLI